MGLKPKCRECLKAYVLAPGENPDPLSYWQNLRGKKKVDREKPTFPPKRVLPNRWGNANASDPTLVQKLNEANKQQAKLEAANRRLEKALSEKGCTVEPPTIVEGDKEKEEQLEDQPEEHPRRPEP